MTDLPRYLKDRLKRLEYPQLLVLKEKHSREYYLVKDESALFRAFLEVLDARITGAWINDPGPARDIYGIQDELTEDQAKALPEPYRKQALGTRASNARLRKEHADEVEQYQNAKRAVKEKDGAMAYMILDERRDHEYEGWELESPRIP